MASSGQATNDEILQALRSKKSGAVPVAPVSAPKAKAPAPKTKLHEAVRAPLTDAVEPAPKAEAHAAETASESGTARAAVVAHDMKDKRLSRSTKARTAYVRNIPVTMVNQAVNAFEGQASRTDAVSAYIALKSGETAGLSDTQLALVKQASHADPAEQLNRRMRVVEDQMRDCLAALHELELICAYVQFDRLGFRRTNPSTPADVDLLEPGMDEMLERTRRQAKLHQQREEHKAGRPIR